MPKRTSDAAELPDAKMAAFAVGGQKPARIGEDDEMGEFEDRWEDDIESEVEEEIVGDGAEEDGDDEDVGTLSI
jgi:ribosome assembly protein RRB1